MSVTINIYFLYIMQYKITYTMIDLYYYGKKNVLCEVNAIYLEPWTQDSVSSYNVFDSASATGLIHTLKHQKAWYSRAHITVLFMCLESEWESLGWIATHPNPLSNNVRCGERELICFQFSCFLAIVITLRLSYIGAWALKPSPIWRNTKKWFHKFLFYVFPQLFCFSSF